MNIKYCFCAFLFPLIMHHCKSYVGWSFNSGTDFFPGNYNR